MLMIEEQERCVRVAVELLQTQNPRAISMLKSFLTYIPSPSSVKAILVTAVIKLIDTAPPVICWLLAHPEYLQPEVEIHQIVVQRLSNRLVSLGFVLNQDFYIDVNQNLTLSETAELALSIQSQCANISDPRLILDCLQRKKCN